MIFVVILRISSGPVAAGKWIVEAEIFLRVDFEVKWPQVSQHKKQNDEVE